MYELVYKSIYVCIHIYDCSAKSKHLYINVSDYVCQLSSLIESKMRAAVSHARTHVRLCAIINAYHACEEYIKHANRMCVFVRDFLCMHD